jgi:hypothetical protein
MPSTAATAGPSDPDYSEPDFQRRPLAHAAHTFSPGWGKVPSRALQAPECGHPRSLAFEEQAPFEPVSRSCDLSCLGLTTQARSLARTTGPMARTDCPAVPTPTAAPRRLLRPRTRGPMCAWQQRLRQQTGSSRVSELTTRIYLDHPPTHFHRALTAGSQLLASPTSGSVFADTETASSPAVGFLRRTRSVRAGWIRRRWQRCWLCQLADRR